jgi:hypothetical protein
VQLHLTVSDRPRAKRQSQGPVKQRRLRSIARHPIAVQLAVLFGFIAAGIAVTWPHVTYLAGKLPYTKDAGSYVWGFWWMAHSVLHLTDPWLTSDIAAPAGAQLGLHALMPLAGFVMLPVTEAFGPSASYTVLSVLLPGLMSYAMYRVARLWLPSQTGAIAAGAFFGLSGMLSYQTWVHINLAAGAVFLPLTLEAAIRLRRNSSPGRAAVLGVVLGAAMLVDQESGVLASIIAIMALLPWVLIRRIKVGWLRLLLAGLAGAVAVIVAAPQLVAIAHAAAAGSPPVGLSAPAYVQGVRLPDLFLPSPRVTFFGLAIRHAQNTSTFGALPTLLALVGLALALRRRQPGGTLRLPGDTPAPPMAGNPPQRNAWLLGLLWLGSAALALGSDIITTSGTFTPAAEMFGGVRVSSVLPFTWFVRIPGLSGFREPSRVAELGLVAVALLAGYTVNWLRYRARALLVPVLALGILEAGLATPPGAKTMPTSYPALDRPIAADHSGSIVLDVPFGLRGGTGVIGLPFVAQAQVLATADGHPLADALLSRVPTSTSDAIEAEPFYHDLISAQTGHYQFSPAQLQFAAENAAHMHIGWVLLWVSNKHLRAFLVGTGFRYSYRAYGTSVWRPVGPGNGIATPH